MIPSIRKAYNESFTKEKYEAFLKELHAAYPGELEFRVAETAIFVPKEFTRQMLDTCESIVDIITEPHFKQLTDKAIPSGLRVPRENAHSHFIAFDFGICINATNEFEPQLIEMQGFPSLFAYEVLLDDVYRNHFPVPAGFDAHLGGFNRETYIQLLKEIIIGEHAPANVVLLEIF